MFVGGWVDGLIDLPGQDRTGQMPTTNHTDLSLTAWLPHITSHHVPRPTSHVPRISPQRMYGAGVFRASPQRAPLSTHTYIHTYIAHSFSTLCVCVCACTRTRRSSVQTIAHRMCVCVCCVGGGLMSCLFCSVSVSVSVSGSVGVSPSSGDRDGGRAPGNGERGTGNGETGNGETVHGLESQRAWCSRAGMAPRRLARFANGMEPVQE